MIPAKDAQSFEFLTNYQSASDVNIEIVFESKPGIYSAMNDGLFASRGKWVYFLNCGDLLVKNLNARELVRVLKASQSDWIIFNGIFDWRPSQLSSRENLEKFVRNSGGYISHQTIIASTEFLINLGGFNTKYKIASDTDLITRMYKSIDPQYCDFDLANIEFPVASSLKNRRGRIESMLIALRYSHLKHHPSIWRFFLHREALSLRLRLFRGRLI